MLISLDYYDFKRINVPEFVQPWTTLKIHGCARFSENNSIPSNFKMKYKTYLPSLSWCILSMCIDSELSSYKSSRRCTFFKYIYRKTNTCNNNGLNTYTMWTRDETSIAKWDRCVWIRTRRIQICNSIVFQTTN